MGRAGTEVREHQTCLTRISSIGGGWETTIGFYFMDIFSRKKSLHNTYKFMALLTSNTNNILQLINIASGGKQKLLYDLHFLKK